MPDPWANYDPLGFRAAEREIDDERRYWQRWAERDLDNQDRDDEPLSDCCGASRLGTTDICSECREHADFGKDD